MLKERLLCEDSAKRAGLHNKAMLRRMMVIEAAADYGKPQGGCREERSAEAAALALSMLDAEIDEFIETHGVATQ